MIAVSLGIAQENMVGYLGIELHEAIFDFHLRLLTIDYIQPLTCNLMTVKTVFTYLEPHSEDPDVSVALTKLSTVHRTAKQ